MINLLVADDNIHFATSITNTLLKQNKDLHLIRISTDGKDVLNSLKTEKIDVLLLDLNMPLLDGFEVLNFIKISNLPVSVIAISGDALMISKTLNTSYVYHFLIKGGHNFTNRLNQTFYELITYIKHKNIKKQLLTELCNLGFNITHSGTSYLLDAILLIYTSNNEDLSTNLEKNVYPSIARMYNKSIFNIKSSITKSVNFMYDYTTTYKNKHSLLFGNTLKPTPKFIIHSIISKLMYK